MKNRQKIRKGILLLSFILYPLTYFVMSPDLLLFGASEGVLAGDIMFFAGLLIFSLFGGRLFCGWICPAGALQEYAFAVNNKNANNRFNWIKFVPFVPWIAFFFFLIASAGGIKQTGFFYKRAFGISIAGATEWVMYFGTVAIVLILSLASGKRALCHYLCWVSPFMIVGNWIRNKLHYPSVILKTAPARCNDCRACEKVCSMSLPVAELMKAGRINHSECILCGECADVCTRNVIFFSIS